jgi:hypothetical protein
MNMMMKLMGKINGQARKETAKRRNGGIKFHIHWPTPTNIMTGHKMIDTITVNKYGLLFPRIFLRIDRIRAMMLHNETAFQRLEIPSIRCLRPELWRPFRNGNRV